MPGKLLSTTKVEVTLTELERAARVYRTNQDAYRALGISDKAFCELCQKHNIETPAQRMKQIRTERLWQ